MASFMTNTPSREETGKKQALPDLLSEVLTTHNDPDAVIVEMRAAGRNADLTF